METKKFTVSEKTNKLLNIYKQLDAISDALFGYCRDYYPDDEELADKMFHDQFSPSINKTQEAIEQEIHVRLQDALNVVRCTEI